VEYFSSGKFFHFMYGLDVFCASVSFALEDVSAFTGQGRPPIVPVVDRNNKTIT
jgi:hypothetical protein